MKITGIRTRVVTRRYDPPPANPRATWNERHAVLVFVDTDAGLTGLGEAYTEGGTPDTVVSVIEQDLAPVVVGLSPFARELIRHRVQESTVLSGKDGMAYGGWSGIDMALWDIAGKEAGRPVHELLGGYRDRVFAYASGGLFEEGKTVADLAEEVRGYVAKGFRAVKIKAGMAPLEEDVERVAAVRAAIGPRVRLMLDPVFILNFMEAQRFLAAMEPYDIHFVEAPTDPLDREGWAALRSKSRIPLAGPELKWGLRLFRDVLTAGAVDVLQWDPRVAGGFTEGLTLAGMARAWHRPVSLHHSSTAVSLAACLHLGAAVANCESVEWHMKHDLLFDEAGEDFFRLEDGYMLAPKKPGLGIELD
jgi:L-alanine-DL-glutamate epimerase-like enolase superfamily enzyme